MQKVLPTMPISDLRKDQPKILAMLDTTPVVLLNRGSVAGVLVRAEEWNHTASELEELKRLRRILKGDIALQEFRDHPEQVMTLDAFEKSFADA
jgi:PHD/YefM family antitoxin component YafN of YafNO toxin-antitoxin module